MARKVAQDAMTIDSNSPHNGVFIHGFPYNVNQALHLDNFLGGVNMAIYLASGAEYK